jgi:hypothetical protein
MKMVKRLNSSKKAVGGSIIQRALSLDVREWCEESYFDEENLCASASASGPGCGSPSTSWEGMRGVDWRRVFSPRHESLMALQMIRDEAREICLFEPHAERPFDRQRVEKLPPPKT